ncbi:hypothetical protein BDV38DRAFT_278040 [Aspergillus pseudotamarii]|uniref:Uncharacterized protein n=1 Tax=Aspergillus pseudotamarii TaxID=132259 RepID=A0A5N6T881_ASPPS|nr:uncharacterized protein BDV38DRAFT_278040 [Aspergillus pseudotamarii]KAE8142512.1 hypothetical protein BDV38DRAFT_278040 [Aspergillus pseudotamarii]
MNGQHNDRSAPQPNRQQPRWVMPDPYDPQEDLFKHEMRRHYQPTEKELGRRGSLFSQCMMLDATQSNLAAVFVDIPKNPISTGQALLDAINEVTRRVIGSESRSDESEEDNGYAGLPDDDLAEWKERIFFMFEMEPTARTSSVILEALDSFIQHANEANEHMSKLEEEQLPIEVFKGYTMTKADPKWAAEEYDRQYAIAKPYEDWAPCEALEWLERAECSETIDLDD